MRAVAHRLLLSFLLTACARPDPRVVPVPHPDREGMEATVAAAFAEAITKAEEARPPRATAFAELGQLYLAHALVDAARACFTNAAALDPANARWTYLRGVVEQMMGDPTAEASFARAHALAPEDVAPLLRRGDVLLELGRPDDARAAFAAALANDPGSARAATGLGKVALAERDAARALEHFAHALRLQPAATALHSLRAEAYRLAGDAESAEREGRARGETEVGFPDPAMTEIAAIAQRHAVMALKDLAQRSTEFAAADLNWAVTAIGAAGLEELVAAAGETSLSARARARLELVHATVLARRREPGVLESLRRASALDPGFALAHQHLGNRLAAEGRLAEAVAVYDALIARAGAEPAGVATKLLDDARLHRATARLELGQFEPALLELRELRDLHPDRGAIRIRLATVLNAIDRPSDAAAELDAALASDLTAGERALALLLVAERLTRSGDLTTALARQREATESMPESADAWRALALTSARLGRIDDSAVAFARLTKLEPNDSAGQRGLAASLLQLGRWAEARSALELGVAALPRDLGLKRVLARLLAAAPDTATRDATRALLLADELVSMAPSPLHADTRAMALAAAAEFDDAAALLQDEVLPHRSGGDAARARARLDAYRARRVPPADAADLLAAEGR